jgi:hypothetical protein
MTLAAVSLGWAIDRQRLQQRIARKEFYRSDVQSMEHELREMNRTRAEARREVARLRAELRIERRKLADQQP